MKIEILFPEIGNLYGDLQNVEYLRRSLELNGENVEIIETSLKKEPYFVSHDDMNMIYMGTMTERSLELALAALTPYTSRIKELIDNNTIFLITGNALEIFGEYIECDDYRRIECLKIFKTHAIRRMLERYNSLYVGKYNDIDIVGFKSQFAHSYGEYEGLFDTVRGDGLNPGEKKEGMHVNNFFSTYLSGPLLILNPGFTKYIMRLMGAKSDNLAYEEAAMDNFDTRLKEFLDPERGFSF